MTVLTEMMHRTAVALFVSLLAGVTAQAETDRGYFRDIRWTAKPAVSADALWFFRGRDKRHESTMLATAPSGRRYVFTNVMDAPGGSTRTRLTDDETGWWIELTNDLGIRRPSMDALVRAFDPATLPAGYTVAYTLRTSSNTNLAPTRISWADGNEHETLAAHLKGSATETAILREAPAGILDDLSFFEAAFTGDNEYGFEFRPVVVVLRALLGGKGLGGPIEIHASRPFRGTLITDEKRYAYTSAFRSLPDATDPLPLRQRP